MCRTKLFPFAVCAGALLFTSVALADGTPREEPKQEVQNVPAEKIDPRLPPVIPGQRVTAGGSKHKVISTAGPVPVSSAPPAPRAPAIYGNGYVGGNAGVGVIVDRRDD